MRHETVVANGLTFHYLTEGEGPLLLLLHGFPQYSGAWRRQIPALAKKFRVVAPDLRGYGDTDKPPRVSDYAITKLAADVAGLVRALGETKAVVVGHDWGGAAAYATALEHPEVVERLIVLNCPHPALFLRALTSGTAQLKRSWYMGFFQLPWLPERMMRKKVDRLIAASSVKPEVFTAEDRAGFLAAMRKPGAATGGLNYYRAAFRGYSAAKRVFDESRKIAAPTLLIWGDLDHALGKELTEGMEPLFSGGLEIRHVPDASHWVAEEKPELVNELILGFSTGAPR
jgi:epoxide hydrolase 4